MKLKDTTILMNSKDYKKRFKAEYYQLKIRHDKLEEMCDKWDRGELNFIPTCPRSIFTYQLSAMENYMNILEERAKIENIDLSDIDAINYKDVVDKCLDKYKNQNFDWWSWDDFKTFLKKSIENAYGKMIDLRSSEGREILHYARNKWEMDE